jgi:hypothetical protein
LNILAPDMAKVQIHFLLNCQWAQFLFCLNDGTIVKMTVMMMSSIGNILLKLLQTIMGTWHSTHVVKDDRRRGFGENSTLDLGGLKSETFSMESLTRSPCIMQYINYINGIFQGSFRES